ncbi:MAG TPA: pilin [Luteibacter sp.]|uniref:pilin n=1 Tax=Luteibacter sp. TaxID=1886636 RepID=UPI002B8BAA71|nr:pilin [Luteibacter sp.]HVI54781.1 pilin [Luteibacter sp.]
MIARRTVLLSAAIAAALGLAACHKKDEAPTADPKAVAAAQAAISSPAWLRQHLPAQAVAYLRLPSPWAVIGGVPSGRPLDTALSAKANLDAVAKLRETIAKDKVLADAKIGPALNLLLGDLRSPLEVVLLDPLGIPSPTSRLVATGAFSFDSVAAFNARLASLDAPLLVAPLDAQGNGKLASGGSVRYVVAEHRLWVTQSMQQPSDGHTIDELIATFAKSSVTTAPATLSALEAHIDTSGEGLFGWATIRGIGAVAANQAGESPLGKLPTDFASKADAFAFGSGTVDGHGQFRMVVHSPQARVLQYAAPRSFAPTVKSAGEPRWAMTFALPNAEGYKAFEDNLNLDFGADRAKTIRDGLAKMRATYGFDVADYTKWMGPESIVFADDAGQFVAIRARDLKAWHARIDEMTKAGRWRTGEMTVDDAKVHWLFMPGAPYEPDVDHPEQQALVPFMTLMRRFGSRMYWVEEGDWIVLAKIPQALADRAAAKPDTSLEDWFKGRAYPGSQVLMGYTANSRDAQRDAYYTYIEILQMMGGMAGTDLDIARLPAAHTLGLPEKGVVGAAIEADTDTLSISFTYEQSPMELVGQMGSAGALGTTAILAAIAIPQYQQYVLRSQVSSALMAADPAKVAVTERRLATGKFPANNAAAGLGKPETLGNEYAGSVEVGQGGEIVVTLDTTPPHKTDPKLDSGQLILTPKVDGKTITWTCSADGIDAKNLPQSCRDEPISP